jgi:hypothetical protein
LQNKIWDGWSEMRKRSQNIERLILEKLFTYKIRWAAAKSSLPKPKKRKIKAKHRKKTQNPKPKTQNPKQKGSLAGAFKS